ncbi:RibD family protein [Tepidiforma sp.]|uniref:RibD family protein n=1 Tax=Tepidiforma sp. TaxID=2682230 RepID=UPI002ADD4E9F|nr:dihydrofolate reductase family protein [Tepidiforma sp.]
MPKPDYTALEFPAAPAERPYVIINMVMSVDGKVVVDGTEQGIGSPIDQRLMRELRTHADVVLNGAETLRVSGSSSRLGDPALEQLRIARGKPRLPIAATVSASGDLPLDRAFFTANDFEAVVYLDESAPPERIDAVHATGRPVVLLPARDGLSVMLAHMRHELGAGLLLCEGGPTLNAGLFALDAVDELFITIGPRVIAGRDSLTPVEGPLAFTRETMKQLELAWAVPSETTAELYCRYRVRR